ncbi:MAG: DUF1579 family protein [Deltaproteobacteria bacterium]|nr:DUF1579 family protein [Deltaproteobacteria bacterium]
MLPSLEGLDGTWTGTTKTWLDPTAPPSEASITATVTTAVERWMRIAYTSAVAGKAHTGEMTFGYHADAKQYEMVWLDTFHTGTAMMFCSGTPGAERVEVLGSYAAGPERWGWRTLLERPSTGELVVSAVNIDPAGTEYPAIELRLRRA